MNDLPDKALLPAGMQDGLPPEAAVEARTLERLVTAFGGWGYRRVKPPLIEFEENLLSGNGQAMSAEAFRVQDPVSQRMLALRPDMTLQVARIAASRLGSAARPLRLAYGGEVLRVKGSQLRPERQFAQVGAELIGVDDPKADVEVMVMAIEALGDAGAVDLSVDIGLPQLVSAIISNTEMDITIFETLRAHLDRKDAAGTRAMAGELDKEVCDTLCNLLDATGPADGALKKLSALKLKGEAGKLIEALGDVVSDVSKAMADVTLTVDAVENRGFEYHTGVTFSFFAQGVRGELGRGGRYVAGSNGNEEPATGLTLFMDTVMRAVAVKEEERAMLLPVGTPRDTARKLRAEGWVTVAQLDADEDEAEAAHRLGCSHVWSGGKAKALD